MKNTLIVLILIAFNFLHAGGCEDFDYSYCLSFYGWCQWNEETNTCVESGDEDDDYTEFNYILDSN